MESFIRGKPGELFSLPVYIDLTGVPCQEASPLSHQKFQACGEPARKLILTNREKRLYPMCEHCAKHNIDNREAVLIAEHREMSV